MTTKEYSLEVEGLDPDLGEFHLEARDWTCTRPFPWRRWLPSAPPPIACIRPSAWRRLSLLSYQRRGGWGYSHRAGRHEVHGEGCDSYLWMVAWRVSTLAWQRSRVRLVMLTLMESMHTLSRRGVTRERERESGKQVQKHFMFKKDK